MPPSARRLWERRQIGWIKAYMDCLLARRQHCLVPYHYSGVL